MIPFRLFFEFWIAYVKKINYGNNWSQGDVSCSKEHLDLPLAVARGTSNETYLRSFTVIESQESQTIFGSLSHPERRPLGSQFKVWVRYWSSPSTMGLGPHTAISQLPPPKLTDVPRWRGSLTARLSSLDLLLPDPTLWFFTALIKFLFLQEILFTILSHKVLICITYSNIIEVISPLLLCK